MNVDIPTDLFTYPDIPLPEVWTVEQKFDTPALSSAELVQQVRAAVGELCRDPRLHAGATVAIGCGSRGVDNLLPTVRTVVGELRQRGMKPFLVPAMGSHGGATAGGQREVLETYGLTPDAVDADIQATMEVDEIGRMEGPDAGPFAGHAVFQDRSAHGADAILVVNRIKPHTDFTGPIESGIGKMCAIGLGKQRGAEGIHRHGAYGLRELMPRVARFLAAHTPIVGGVALIENELGHTAEVHAVPAKQVASAGEAALLGRARTMIPRIPFEELDVLVIDEIGKNISGTGLDTHVVGRALMPSIPESEWGGPRIRLILALDVTAATHGNVAGLGLADIVTRRLIEQVDFRASWINMRTSGEGGVTKSRIPLVLETAEDCVRTAIGACGRGDHADVRLARLRNTADTRFLEISAALLDEARKNSALRVEDAGHRLDLRRPVALAK